MDEIIPLTCDLINNLRNDITNFNLADIRLEQYESFFAQIREVFAGTRKRFEPNMQTYEYLMCHLPYWLSRSKWMTYFASTGRDQLLRYGLEHGMPFSQQTVIASIRDPKCFGLLIRFLNCENVHLAIENGYTGPIPNSADIDRCMSAAIRSQNIDAFKRLIGTGYIPTKIHMREIGNFAQIDFMSACIARNIEIPFISLVGALQSGRGEIVELLVRSFPAFLTIQAMMYAMSGKNNMGQLMRALGCPWDFTSTASAAYHGNLSGLVYAHQNGCPINETVAICAATAGQLKCLEYLHGHCRFSSKVMTAAVRRGKINCVIYLCAMGITWDSRATEHTVGLNPFEMTPFNEIIVNPRKCLACLRYVWFRGCPMNAHCADNAKKQNHPQCEDFARSARAAEQSRIVLQGNT